MKRPPNTSTLYYPTHCHSETCLWNTPIPDEGVGWRRNTANTRQAVYDCQICRHSNYPITQKEAYSHPFIDDPDYVEAREHFRNYGGKK